MRSASKRYRDFQIQNGCTQRCDIGRVPAPEVYQYMFRVLETDDEYFEHVEPNAGLPWRV